MKIYNKSNIIISSKQMFVLMILLLSVFTSAFCSNIDSVDKWAWGTNAGWINFSPTHADVNVWVDHLEGYIYGENSGWIRLGTYTDGGAHTYTNDAAGNYGVNNNGSGTLSGLAWSTNAGWIDFNPAHGGVSINQTTGDFSGYAWSENIGWIKFAGTATDATEYLVNNGEGPLLVTLSSFTIQYLNELPVLYWTTQSETNNLGWNVYRSETDIFEEAIQINVELIPGAGTTSEPTDYIYEDESELMENTEYWYWLESIDYSGLTDSYGSISLIIPQQGEEPGSPEIPDIYGLYQNYPNPFNPSTEISFMMKENCIAELSIYNIKSQKIKTLFTNLSIPRDELIIYIWNGKDESGKEVSTGVYHYKLRTTKGNYVRKMILLK